MVNSKIERNGFENPMIPNFDYERIMKLVFEKKIGKEELFYQKHQTHHLGHISIMALFKTCLSEDQFKNLVYYSDLTDYDMSHRPFEMPFFISFYGNYSLDFMKDLNYFRKTYKPTYPYENTKYLSF